jgi:hypothetical protein
VALEFTDECMEKPGQRNEHFQGFSQTSTLLPQMKGGTEKGESRHFADMSATRTSAFLEIQVSEMTVYRPCGLPGARLGLFHYFILRLTFETRIPLISVWGGCRKTYRL